MCDGRSYPEAPHPSFPNPLNSGAAVDLDDCGGHTHDAYGYHYHSQLVSMQDSQGAFTSYVSGTWPNPNSPGPRHTPPKSPQAPTNAGRATSVLSHIFGWTCPRARLRGALAAFKARRRITSTSCACAAQRCNPLLADRADYELVRSCCGVAGSTRMYYLAAACSSCPAHCGSHALTGTTPKRDSRCL